MALSSPSHGDGPHQRLMRLRLDEQGREDIAGLVADLVDEVREIEAESASRLACSQEAPQYLARLSIVRFGRP